MLAVKTPGLRMDILFHRRRYTVFACSQAGPEFLCPTWNHNYMKLHGQNTLHGTRLPTFIILSRRLMQIFYRNRRVIANCILIILWYSRLSFAYTENGFDISDDFTPAWVLSYSIFRTRHEAQSVCYHLFLIKMCF